MDENFILDAVIELLNSYLTNEIKAAEFVKRYDNIIINDAFPWNSKNIKIQSLDKFQDELSLFVENKEWRKQHQSYYDEKELRKKTEDFKKYLIEKPKS